MEKREYLSRQSKAERIFSVAYLPVHVYLAPLLAALLLGFSGLKNEHIVFMTYSIGAVYMLATQWRFLRRDFDMLCERPFNCLYQVLMCYIAMTLIKSGIDMLLMVILGEETGNPNDAALIATAQAVPNSVKAAAIFLSPIIEELMFRAGVFGWLREHSRVWAYVGSMLLFALYHVWPYLSESPVYLLFMFQYLPAGYALCRCYEQTDSIWAAMLLHGMTNAVSFSALEATGAL